MPGIFFENSAVLSLYAQGKYTGIVCDIGDGVTQIVPVVDAYTVKNAIKRINLAGRDVTEYLFSLIQRLGYVGMHTSAEFQIVKTIKEKLGKVSKIPLDENKFDHLKRKEDKK